LLSILSSATGPSFHHTNTLTNYLYHPQQDIGSIYRIGRQE